MSILISYDKAGYESCIYALEQAVPVLQDTVNAFLKLSIGDLKQDEFGRLFSDPVGLVFDKVTGGSLKIGNLTIRKERAIELIDLPDGYSYFLSTVQNGINYLAQRRTPNNNIISSRDVKEWYVMNQGHKVELNSETVERNKKHYQKFLNTPTGKKMYEFGKFILEKYKDLGVDTIAHNGTPMKEIVGEIITYTPAAGYTLRVDGLLRIDHNGKL